MVINEEKITAKTKVVLHVGSVMGATDDLIEWGACFFDSCILGLATIRRKEMIQPLLFPTFFIALSYALFSAAPVAAQSHRTHQHNFKGTGQQAQEFDDPKRDAWQKPHEVIEALGLRPDAVVADIGSGTGYFAVRLGHMVPNGRIYGVDIAPDMVKHLAERAKRDGLKNVSAVKGVPDDPLLPEKVELILMVNTFHHIENRERYLRTLRDSLKPDGRIAIIDPRLDSIGGPPISARSTPEAIKSELARAGYTLVQEHDFLPNQYFLIFQAGKF